MEAGYSLTFKKEYAEAILNREIPDDEWLAIKTYLDNWMPDKFYYDVKEGVLSWEINIKPVFEKGENANESK